MHTLGLIFCNLIFLTDGNDLSNSITSSLSTSTGLSSSHSTVDSVKNNRNVSLILPSPSMNSTLLEKESMVANFGDTKVDNSFSESSFVSTESSSGCSPKTNAEDSGIDDRSGSLDKVKLEIGEEGQVKQSGPVAVSSPADVSTPPTDSQGQENKSFMSSLLSDQNETPFVFKESGSENDAESKEESSEMVDEQGDVQ